MTAYEAEANATGGERLLLTMAAPGDEVITDVGYDIPALTASLDFVNLKAFDLRGPNRLPDYPRWDETASHHASLFPGFNDDPDEEKLTVSYSVEGNWVKKGCPPKKLIVGLALYGLAWTLYPYPNIDCAMNTNYAPGPSSPGPYTGEDGFWGYFEICTKLKAGMTVYWDSQRMVPFGCDTIEWVGYDDTASFYNKADYIQWGDRSGLMPEGLGGGMVWALDLDDFTGNFCDDEPWPLMRNVRKFILEGVNWPIPPTTPPSGTFCEDNGYYNGLYALELCDPGILNVNMVILTSGIAKMISYLMMY
ncbi:acidic mammalian chitinase-like [Amphiura filiformis]|uniref:acidic mammalian chitinase-like n=1 Tax=Amphiura filiformis TaxID=82378 RepID=UPI003B219848